MSWANSRNEFSRCFYYYINAIQVSIYGRKFSCEKIFKILTREISWFNLNSASLKDSFCTRGHPILLCGTAPYCCLYNHALCFRVANMENICMEDIKCAKQNRGLNGLFIRNFKQFMLRFFENIKFT